MAAGLFFLCFWMLYRVGGACGGFAGVLARLGRAGPLLRAALLASSFVLCAGMLAGLHSLAREGAGVGLSFPLLSLLALPLLYGLSGRGMRGLYAADALLVPLILCSSPPMRAARCGRCSRLPRERRPPWRASACMCA